jgi:hypothetical protein
MTGGVDLFNLAGLSVIAWYAAARHRGPAGWVFLAAAVVLVGVTAYATMQATARRPGVVA